jgi:hypothetical protein
MFNGTYPCDMWVHRHFVGLIFYILWIIKTIRSCLPELLKGGNGVNLMTENATCANTDGWGNKLVTVFARHLDNFILTINFSLTWQIHDFGSGQILPPRQLYPSPVPIVIGIAKIAPWWHTCWARLLVPSFA